MDSVNIVLIGNTQSGKTTLTNLLTDQTIDEDYTATRGVSRNKLSLIHGQQIVPANIWDTPGDKQYHTVLPHYLRNADIIIFVLDVTQQHVNHLDNFKTILAQNQANKKKNYAKFIIANKPINKKILFDINSLPQVASQLGWEANDCTFLRTDPYTDELHKITYKSSSLLVYKGHIQQSLPPILYNQLTEKGLLKNTAELLAARRAKQRTNVAQTKQRKHRRDAFAGGVSGATIGLATGLCFMAYGIYSMLLLPVHPLGISLIVFGAATAALCATILFFLIRKEHIAKRNDQLWMKDSNEALRAEKNPDIGLLLN